MTTAINREPAALRVVIPFVFRHWLNQPAAALTVAGGLWALDLLNDTILMALLPSLVVLLGSMILLGLRWASLGLVIALGALIYVSMTVAFSTRYIAPAARVSNAWDTRVGGTLADALTCNAVVKSFGA